MNMDVIKVASLLKNMKNPDLQKETETQLDEMHKMPGFAPLLLQLIMSKDAEMSILETGADYLRTICSKSWLVKDKDPKCFSFNEEDHAKIRINIIEDFIRSPIGIREHLIVVIRNIICPEYPSTYPELTEKIEIYLSSDDAYHRMGAVVVLYQLLKSYVRDHRILDATLIAAMKKFLPVVYQLITKCMEEDSVTFALHQKLILKVLCSLTEMTLPLELFDEETLDKWMKLLCTTIEQPILEDSEQDENIKQLELMLWKVKKWALRFIKNIFERYGNSEHIIKGYEKFAKSFPERYAVTALGSVMRFLDENSKKKCIAPKGFRNALFYLVQCVMEDDTWNVLKDSYGDILETIIFPLLCINDEWEAIWKNKPSEYVSKRLSIRDRCYYTPAGVSSYFLRTLFSKRQEVVKKTIEFCHRVSAPSSGISDLEAARKKSGALAIVGLLADSLSKIKKYKTQMKTILMKQIIPELSSEHGFIRAEACWVVQQFSNIGMPNKDAVAVAEKLKSLLIPGNQLPMRISAALALLCFFSGQPKAKKHFEPNLWPILQAMLQLLPKTDCEELFEEVSSFINDVDIKYIKPHAVEIIQNMSTAVIEKTVGLASDPSVPGYEETPFVAANHMMTIIHSILCMVDDNREIVVQVEESIATLFAHIIKKEMLGDNMTYHVTDGWDGVCQCVQLLTQKEITPQMWEILTFVGDNFEKIGCDEFCEMVCFLHNYCVKDTVVLLSDPKYLKTLYSMCKSIINLEIESAGSHASKLLEILILQYSEEIDQYIPLFIETVLLRLAQQVEDNEMKLMCLQVVVAALYCSPTLTLDTLETMTLPNTTEPMSEHFVRQWINEIDEFSGLHNRKVSILGLCTLLNQPNRPSWLNNLTHQIIPSFIVLFQGLHRSSKVTDAFDDDDGDDDDDDDDDNDGDDDDVDDDGDDDDVDDDDDDDSDGDGENDDNDEYVDDDEKNTEDEEVEIDESMDQEKAEGWDVEPSDKDYDTSLDVYATALENKSAVDEFIYFRDSISKMKAEDPTWHTQLVIGLSEEQRRSWERICKMAEERSAAAGVKKTEKS